MKAKILLFVLIISALGIQAQVFKQYSGGLTINTFFHQQGINYYLGTTNENGQLYFIHYDTVSSGFQFGKEFSIVRLQIYNGFTWLSSNPIQLFSRNTIDAPRVLDLQYANGKVYLAGSFDSSTNNLGAGLIAFDGANWQSTNSNLMQVFPDYFEVRQILSFDGKLMITGNFDSIPGAKVNGLLWHDGNNWNPVGQSAPYGFRNLSGTGNVFFKVANDSLYAFNKNKINPDSIEIGGTIAKRLAVFSNGGFIQTQQSGNYISALSEYNQALVRINSSAILFTSSISVRQGSSWEDYLLPDSFYVTNYVGSFEKNGLLFLLFQNPAPAQIQVYTFDGSTVNHYKNFKISAQYINLEFFEENNYNILSGVFQDATVNEFKERHNKVLGIVFDPQTQINGICFHDINNDGNYQIGEPLLSDCKVYDVSNLYLAKSDINGRYTVNLPIASTKSIKAVNPYGLEATQTFELVDSKDSLYHIDFALNSTNSDDVGVYITSHTANKAKQGFVSKYHIDVVNYSKFNKSINVQVMHNKRLSQRYLKDFTALTSNQEGFTFNVILDPHTSKRYFFEGVYSVDSFQLGENVQVNCKFQSSDDNSINNIDTVYQIVKAAFDPNIKVANPEVVVNKDKLIQYMIWFQNEGNDTALHVTVVDTFGTLFNLSAVYLGQNSHPCEIELVNNCVLWHFKNIKLPPKYQDSTGSIGYVSFRSKLAKNAVLGDTVFNKAAIFFDYQKPIITNKVRVLYDKPSSITQVDFVYGISFYPNPSIGTIFYENTLFLNQKVDICDVNGKIIFTTILAEDGEIIFPEGTSQGIYFIKIQESGIALGKVVLVY